LPGTLLERFNTDPLLACALLLLAFAQISWLQRPRERVYAALGWGVAAAALMSPLCALSVALFSARITQHMILVLLAAPLIALGWPAPLQGTGRSSLWSAAIAFFAALWFWHMPLPYDATFSSTGVYWSMHITLFGSAVLLWRELLQQSAGHTADVLAAGALTSMQMGLLGAVLALAGRPLFFWHLTTTAAWKLTPLQDQQLGGTIMWVPGILLFLWAAMRSLQRLRVALDRADAA
jgi:putative membrane protein